MQITFGDALERYGAVENGIWLNEALWCVRVKIPKEISRYWINSLTNQPTRVIYCNKDMGSALILALDKIVDRGLEAELKSFDGCYSVRNTRVNPRAISCHAYALALDINAQTNVLGKPGDISEKLADCFTESGFTHGRTFHRRDDQHFSFAWE